MDETRSLFKKMKSRNHGSFQTLSDSYGWKLYSYIRKNCQDRDAADRIFADTVEKFYASVDSYQGDDPIEALLYACADEVRQREPSENPGGGEMSQWSIGHESGFSLPEVDEKTICRKKGSAGKTVFFTLCMIVLIIAIAAALWILLWMLMEMKVVPDLDLGYSWFNEHIAWIF